MDERAPPAPGSTMEGGEAAADERVRRAVETLFGGGAEARTLEALTVLRRDVLVQTMGARRVREAGGLERLVSLLRRGSERVLDSALSALATCCLEDESCLAVGKLNVSVPLVLIMKTWSRDSIVGRACRLLGNLAQKTTNAESLHAAGAVSALLATLERRDNNTTNATLTMLVRAIRLLWMTPGKRKDMLSAGAVRAIVVLLTTECESAGLIKTASAAAGPHPDDMSKSQEELFAGLVKCIGYFATPISVERAEQLQGDGRGYQCLVALTRTHETMALKCLMELCCVESCRPLLGTAGFVECLVGVLQKHSEVEWWPEGAARALGQLSQESVNRLRLRYCGGLQLLVVAARASDQALHSLLQYTLDDTALQDLLNVGLVGMLTDELSSYVSTMKYEHEESVLAPPPAELVVSRALSPTELVVGRALSPTDLDDAATQESTNMMVEKLKALIAAKSSKENDSSDASDDDDDDDLASPQRHKRNFCGGPHSAPVHTGKFQFTRTMSYDCPSSWQAEPKSPEGPSSGRLLSPNRPQHSPWSALSDQSGRSPEYGGFAKQCKRRRWEWSPDSGVGSGSGEGAASPYWAEYQWSPSSSGSDVPPLHHNYASSDSEFSGLYSPVCSDSESDEELCEDTAEVGVAAAAAEVGSEAGLGADLVLQELDDLIIQLNAVDKVEMSSKSSRVGCVLMLLLRMSHCLSAHSALKCEPAATSLVLDLLTRKPCLTALLDYLNKCRRPLQLVAKILTRVFSNPISLIPLLRSRLTLRLRGMSLHSPHPTAACNQCRQVTQLSSTLLGRLAELAESDYGVGEICYQLLKGQPTMKQTLCITLPFIVRIERPLKKYFIECSGLTALFTSIDKARESLEDCVSALSHLASNLKVKDPKSLELRFDDETRVSYDPILDGLRADEVVAFQLDDSSTVVADKVFLCQNSEVFRAMLMGQFKESVEKCVRLKKVTKEGLEYLLSLVQCGLNAAECEVQTFPLAERLEVCLEVLLLADRFLLERVRDRLRSAIVQFQLSPSTVHRVYVWSLNEGMGVLCVEAVAYLLVGRMSDTERAASFDTILRLQYRQQWLDDLKAVVQRQLVA